MIARPANDNIPQPDRRRAARRRVLLRGKLTHLDRRESSDCTIRDLSGTGATIALAAPQLLPVDPVLILVRDGVAHEAKTVWNRGGRAGLRFLRTYHLGRNTPARLDGVRKLWIAQALR